MRVERNFVLTIKLRDGQRQRGFQPGDAERGALEFDLLFVDGVRGMIGSDGVHGAVGKRDDNRFAVSRGTQRRVHLKVRVVFADILVQKREMVRRNFAGHSGFCALAAAHGLEGVSSGEMGHVQARFANLLGERDIAVDDARFGRRRHAAQAQPKAGGPEVHRTVLGESRVLCVLHHGKIQFRAQTQSHAHDFVVEDRLSIVGDGNCSSALQRLKVGEGLSLAAKRGGGDGKNVDHGCAFGTAQPSDPFRSVNHWRRVGHGADRGEPAGSSGGSTAGDSLFVILTGLTQMDVQVDETRRNDEAARVELFVGAAADFIRQSDLSHAAIPQEDVHGRVDLRPRIDQVAAFDQQARGFAFLVLSG